MGCTPANLDYIETSDLEVELITSHENKLEIEDTEVENKQLSL